MTTAAPGNRRPARRGRALLGPLSSTILAGLLAVALAAVVAGSPAAAGAGIGATMVVLFFSLGAVVLDLVTSRAPAASLLVALLTYTLKIVLVGLVFFGLSGSGALESAVDPRWLGGTVIGCTLVWLVSQIVFGMRARIPVYDLPADDQEASVR